MDNTEENAVELHGDEEIIEVIELNDTEPGPGVYKTNFEPHLLVCYGSRIWTFNVKTN